MVDTIKARSELERRVALSLRERSAGEAMGIIREVCRIAESAGDHREGPMRECHEAVTGAAAYERPATRRRIQKARAVLMSRDVLNGRAVKGRYDFGEKGKRSEAYCGELASFEEWLMGLGMSGSTVRTKMWRAQETPTSEFAAPHVLHQEPRQDAGIRDERLRGRPHTGSTA